MQSIARIEWRRRRLELSIWTLCVIGAWNSILWFKPEWMDGSVSADVLFLTASLYAARLASDAFARDTRTGVWEFYLSNGARPWQLFATRLGAAALATAAFAAVFIASEQIRLAVFFNGKVSSHWLDGRITTLAANPREAVMLYLLPSAAIFALLSSLARASTVAFVGGAAVLAGLFFADRSLGTAKELAPLTSATATLSLAALTVAALALAACAAWVRRREPERAEPRKLLLGAAGVLCSGRFLGLALLTHVDVAASLPPLAIAVAPHGRFVAFEAEAATVAPALLAWGSDLLGRPVAGSTPERATVVVIADPEGRSSLASTGYCSLEPMTSGDAWLTERCVQLRGPDPYRCDGSAPCAVYVYDAEARRLLPPPTYWRGLSDNRGAQWWTRKGDAYVGRNDAEAKSSGASQILGELAGNRRLEYKPGEGVLAVGVDDGSVRKLWPPPAVAPPALRPE